VIPEDDEPIVVEALAFYNRELRAILETDRNGDHVAIHVDSRSYEVAERSGAAHRALRSKHPDGVIVVHKIGPPDYELVDRMRGRTPR
jgi:predicted Fe-Mo cluster-binding NifX family protein